MLFLLLYIITWDSYTCCIVASYVHDSILCMIIRIGKCVNESDESNESDDELSTGVAVAISIVVTFIITLVVTALISIIITSLYYKHRYGLKEKVRMDDDDRKINTYKQEPYDATDTNPTFGTATTFKTNTNSPYTVTTL